MTPSYSQLRLWATSSMIRARYSQAKRYSKYLNHKKAPRFLAELSDSSLSLIHHIFWYDAILDFDIHDKTAHTIINVIDAAMKESATDAVMPKVIKPTQDTSATDNA